METIPGCSHQWEIETAVNDSGEAAGQCQRCGEHRMFVAIFEAVPGKQRISTRLRAGPQTRIWRRGWPGSASITLGS